MKEMGQEVSNHSELQRVIICLVCLISSSVFAYPLLPGGPFQYGQNQTIKIICRGHASSWKICRLTWMRGV